MYIGTLLVAPLILGNAHHVNASSVQNQNVKIEKVGSAHESYQDIANHHPQAVKNNTNKYRAYDGNYWTNRVNRTAYLHRNSYHPLIGWNARDLGGIPAIKGYHTRYGKVFRGNALHNISNRGINEMRRLHINKVIDLRSHHYQGGRDKSIKGVQFLQYPVNTQQQKTYLRQFKGRYGGEVYKYGTSFATWYQPRWAYRQVFNQLLYHNNGATYIHCIDGRDRTGIISALYLAALGVSKWQIFNNYLITNYYNYKHSYRSQVAQLNRFYNVIDSDYGSINNYLRKGVGLTNGQINRLRSLYLVKDK